MIVAGSSHVLTSLHLFISFFFLRTSQTFYRQMYWNATGSFQVQVRTKTSLKFNHRFSYAGGLNLIPPAAWDSLQTFPKKELFLEVRDVAREHSPITCSSVKCIHIGVSHSLTKSSSFLMEHMSSTCPRYLTLIRGVYDESFSVHIATCMRCMGRSPYS